MAALVPFSVAGAAALVRYLQISHGGFEWCDLDDQIAANLIAGLERLGEQAP